jgi:hypothetical protein
MELIGLSAIWMLTGVGTTRLTPQLRKPLSRVGPQIPISSPTGGMGG